MKKKQIASMIILPLIILGIMIVISPFFTRQEDYIHWNSFYAQEDNSIDILLLGSSIIEVAIDPYQLEEETGLSAFNFGVAGCSSSVRAGYLREVLKNQNPKLVVVEVYRFIPTHSPWAMSTDNASFALDGMKPSWNKWRTIWEMPVSGDPFEKISFLIPGEHHQWEALNANGYTSLREQTYDRPKWNGTQNSVAPQKPNTVPSTEVLEPTKEMTDQIDKLIEICQENDIQLLFFNASNPEYIGESYAYINGMYQYLDSKGIPHFDINYEPELLAQIDNSEDYFDYHHLNDKGAKKNTTFLADYINENFLRKD
ncbi:MAG: hypothetical protein MJ105_01235 [Lachnospiraceae bacterium]|nr:hypothetical protein [Lachnospiraceae bacterium]